LGNHPCAVALSRGVLARAVEIELEAQFLRDIKEEAEKVAGGQKRIIKRLRAVDADASSRFEVDLALAAEAYGRKTEALKAELGIRSIPTGGPDLAEFVGRAAHRTPPFEEFRARQGRGRDWVPGCCHSVLDPLSL